MEWIKSSEKLPEKGERVLVSSIYGIQIGWLTVNNDWQFCNDGHQFTVEHWMPLPELPCEGKTLKYMSNLPSKEENPNGLHQRYFVAKANGEPVDENAEYFILRLDLNGSDKKHIDACRKAVLKYADEIANHLPQLSEDIIRRYGGDGNQLIS